MTITIYSKPNCPACFATIRAMTRRGLDFQTIDLTGDPAALAMVKSMGHQTAPVVIADGQHWSGFRPELIEALPVEKGP